MLVLDTDHLSILERQSEAANALQQRLRAASGQDRAVTTTISYEEQMRGWMAYLARCRSVTEQIDAYARLLRHLTGYQTAVILEFDEVAAVEYQRLRKATPRLAAMDLKIAAIVLSNNATLLSRNLRDFRQIPGLDVQDWTQ